MKISTYTSDDTLVVALNGVLDTWNLLSIGTELKHTIETSTLDVILDLSAVVEIDSTGIDVLLAFIAWLDAHDRQFVLAAAKGAVAATLRQRHIHELVYMMTSVEDALNMVCPTMEFDLSKDCEQPCDAAEFRA